MNKLKLHEHSSLMRFQDLFTNITQLSSVTKRYDLCVRARAINLTENLKPSIYLQCILLCDLSVHVNITIPHTPDSDFRFLSYVVVSCKHTLLQGTDIILEKL